MKAFLIVLFFSFSVSAQDVYKEEYYTNVPINTILFAEIGNKIIEKGNQRTYEAIIIDHYPKKESYLGTEININVGDTLILSKIDEKGKVFNDKTSNTYQGVLIVNEDYDKPKLFTHNPTLHPLSRKIDLKVSKTIKTVFCDKCFRQQFIYNGKSGTTVKFTYREFINNLARPSFTQELQYDLSEGNIVGFKGLRVEVLKANNLDLEYKVIRTFTE